MHAYATDAEDRKTAPIVLAVAAIAAALLLFYVVGALKIQIPWWVDAPSVMGFYGIFYELYDKWLWRVHLGSIRFSRIPDSNGVWVGGLTSSYNEATKINVVVYINQTWSSFLMRLETETSTSYTVMAALNTEESRDPGLKYEYLSEPGTIPKETMHTHRGTGHLRFSSDGKMLAGDYYTGRDRRNFGTLELHFVS